MKKVIIFGLLASLSFWAVGDHHKAGRDSHKAGMFKRVDLNGDGSISMEEHEAAIASMVEKRRARFMAMDADGDGLVTRAEAKAKMKEKRGKRLEGHVHPDRAK